MIDTSESRRLREAGTAGEWKAKVGSYAEEPESYAMGPDCAWLDDEEPDDDGSEQAHADAALMAHAVNALVTLCNEIDRLRAENEQLKAVHAESVSLLLAVDECDIEATKHPNSQSSAPVIRYIKRLDRLRVAIAAMCPSERVVLEEEAKGTK